MVSGEVNVSSFLNDVFIVFVSVTVETIDHRIDPLHPAINQKKSRAD